MITRLIWTIWTSLSAVPRKAAHFNLIAHTIIACIKSGWSILTVSVEWMSHGHRLSLRWRHNGCDSVFKHQPHECLFNRLFRRRSKKTSKLRVTGLCVGNSPGTGEFPAQMPSNAENVSIWWRHHGTIYTLKYGIVTIWKRFSATYLIFLFGESTSERLSNTELYYFYVNLSKLVNKQSSC